MSAFQARIALRYLFARKSHSAVTAIAVVGVVGVAVATAALVCVLSVFNGFQHLLSSSLDSLSPDIAVTSARGKVMPDADALADNLRRVPGVRMVMPSVTDNVLALYGGKEIPVTLKGVSKEAFDSITDLRRLLLSGDNYQLLMPDDGKPRYYYDEDFEEFLPAEGDLYGAAISVGVAKSLNIHTTDATVALFAPKREGRVNLANPLSSFVADSVAVTGIWQARQSDFDKDYVIADISLARKLLQYDTEATALELQLAPGADPSRVAADVHALLGDQFVVKDRLQQQETTFRMVNIEKWVTFLLLAFILLIASFNIISTLSMLVLEKEGSMRILRAMGVTRRAVGGIFAWESFFVTLIGTLGGMILGVVLSLVQQHFGLIKFNADADAVIVNAYPVVLNWMDLLWVSIPCALIGLLTALVTASFARTRIPAHRASSLQY